MVNRNLWLPLAAGVLAVPKDYFVGTQWKVED
jgi:hypothetical protein